MSTWLFVLPAIGATALLMLALACETFAHWPANDAHGAMVYMNAFLQVQLIGALCVMVGFAIARCLAGQLTRRRPAVFDNVGVLWHCTVCQALVGLLLIHGAPHLLS